MHSSNIEHLAPYIDHTLLRSDATPEEIKTLCSQALSFKFASVCVYPSFVKTCDSLLKGSSVKVCTVIGFHHGSGCSETKVFETELAKKHGAAEFDMVLNISALKAKDYSYVESDIKAVVSAAGGLVTKVIFETHLLNDEEIKTACELTQKAGAHFVKTSTGITGGGATEKDIRLMRSVVGPNFGVKASGGVRSIESAQSMIEAGANRIGTSSAAKFLNNDQSLQTGDY